MKSLQPLKKMLKGFAEEFKTYGEAEGKNLIYL